MITTTSLTSITTYNYNFFLVMRTFKIYSLSNFQIHNALLMATVIVLYTPSPPDNFKLSLKPQRGSHVRNPS